ncbi:MAG: hypothetical protein GF341_10630 [candidate division Zixibacteria bacterium]|nr:hypothetical protein [candidate division Zixibacteria bacterium]
MSRPSRAARVGVLFGLSYFAVYLSGSFLADPLSTLTTLVVGTSLLAAFGWVVTRTQSRIGFNPVITAFLWFLLEAALISSGLGNGLVSAVAGQETVFAQASVLFGCLFTTFVIVVINALVVLVTGTATVPRPPSVVLLVHKTFARPVLRELELHPQLKRFAKVIRGPPRFCDTDRSTMCVD